MSEPAASADGKHQVVVEVEMNLTPEKYTAPGKEGVPQGSSLGTNSELDLANSTTESPVAPPAPLSSDAKCPVDADIVNSIDQIFSESTHVNTAGTHVDETIELAATLLKDAKSNRFIEFKCDKQSLQLYQLYYKPVLKWVQYAVILIILGLAAFEEPAVWPDIMPYWACSLVEVLCLFYLGFRVINLASFQHKTLFWKDKKNGVAVALITLSVIDIITYSIWKSVLPDGHAIRWSRALRPLFIVNFPHARQIRRAFRNIRRTVTEIIFVLILFLFSIMLFSLLALKLFNHRGLKDRFGNSYFHTYLDALWSLYVLVTTANNPDIMMPAYDSSNWFALFFICFLIINLYVFMNVLLAVIFNSYKHHLKNEVKEAVFAKRRKLAAAYDLVKEKGRDGVGYFLTMPTWSKLMKAVLPDKSEEQVAMLFQVMDGDGDGMLTKGEFLTSADLLNVPLTEVKDRMIVWDRVCPALFNSPASKAIRLVVLHKIFRYFFDFAILVNAVFIATDIQEAEWFFLALFTIEIFLKFYVYGPRRFVAQFWNVFDVIVIGGAMIATVIEAADNLKTLEGDTLDFILVLRVLRLVKIVNGIDRFKVVITTLVNIGPSIIIYGGVLFTFYYSFAVIGMEIFHDKIKYYDNNTYTLTSLDPKQYYCGNVALKGSEFWADHYCSNNFNNIAAAFVVLFELTVVNQWHVLTSGFELVTHPAVKIYFLFFHLTVVVLIMNIFIAFILEAFILEYSLSKSKFESQFEAKILQLGYALGQKKLEVPGKKAADKESIIEDMEIGTMREEGTRFHVRQSRRKVEVLLQRMFEDELEPDDLGHDELENDVIERIPRKFTLDIFIT